MKHHLLLTVAVAMGLQLGGQIGNAAPIVIDDFSTPDPAPFFLVGFTHLNDLLVEQPGLSEAVGGERDILIEVLGTLNIQSAQLLTGTDRSLFSQGVMQVATAREPATTVTLQYDGTDDDGNALLNSRLLNLDLTDGGTNDRLEIEFLTVDAPASLGLDFVITLTSPGGTAVLAELIPESGLPAVHVSPFAAFAADPGFSFSDVDSMEFSFNGSGVADVDFVIDRIRAVPEPSTLTLILAGLGGLGACIWRRNKRGLSS